MSWIKEAEFPFPFAGVDEAGRGCLAGPVVAAAVILPRSPRLYGLKDSKELLPAQREELEQKIKFRAVAWCVGVSWPLEIDSINILQASLLAMKRAINALKVRPEFLAIDGNQPVPLSIPQKSFIDGDALFPSISAASIIAKTFRDRLLVSLDKKYPGYNFASNKGYATRDHYTALREKGPCRVHRLTFNGVVESKEKQLWLPIP